LKFNKLISKEFFILNNHFATPSTLSLGRPCHSYPLTDIPLGEQSMHIDSGVCVSNIISTQSFLNLPDLQSCCLERSWCHMHNRFREN